MSQVHIFVSYSHDDAGWFADDKLMPRLIKSLEVIGAEVWYDHRRLGGGDPWKQEIVDAIKKAHIAVLLVSRNFLNSDFIREIEMPRVERRFDMGELIVVPILVGHCNWQNVRLLNRPQMVPGKPTPLISYLDSPAEWDRVQEEIFSAIERQVERVREKYHMDAPVRQESMIDPSATITRLSGALPRVPVVSQPDEPKSSERDAPRRTAPRHEAPEYETQDRTARGASEKKPSSLKALIMPVAAAGLATLITAGILLRGSLFGDTKPDAGETVQAQDLIAPTQSGSVPPTAPQWPQQQIPPATQSAPVVQPAQQIPPGPNTGPTTPMPASTPGTVPAQPAPVTVTPAPAAPAAPTPAVVPAPSQPTPATSTSPKPGPSAPKPANASKSPAPKPAAPVQKPAAPTQKPAPQKPSDILEDAAVDILKKEIDKLKR